MSEQFYTILTKIGKAKIANSTVLGTKTNFSKFQLGDGGGSYYNPTEDQTQLKNKLWDGNINSISIDKENPNWIIIEVLLPSNVGGFMIREAAILDDENNMVAIAKYPETYKPITSEGSSKDLLIRTILEVSNASSVTLKVDPTVILATKKDIEILTNQMNNIKIPSKASDVGAVSQKDFDTHLADTAKQIDTLKSSVDNGKNSIYSAVVGKGITPVSKDFLSLTEGVNAIARGQGDAVEGQVLNGITFSNKDGAKRTGTATIASLGGKRYASGSGIIAGEYLTVSGLSFTPRVIKLHLDSNVQIYSPELEYVAKDGTKFSDMFISIIPTYSFSSSYPSNPIVSSNYSPMLIHTFAINSNGFTAHTPFNNTSHSTIYWECYE